MAFLFIDNNTSTDRRSQRLIRSHGMKGKNAGKVIPARGHRRRGEERDEERDETTRSTRSDSVVRSKLGRHGRPLLPKQAKVMQAMQVTPPADPFSGFEFSYFTTPVPVTETSRQLFYNLHNAVSEELYPRAFCRPSNEIGTRWFETVMTNPCVFHCGVAVMAIHRHQLLGRRGEPLDATRHLLQAMRLLRRDLESVKTREAGTIGMITVVISLAIRANLVGAPDEGLTHLRALQQIVELRPGGLVALCAAVPELGNKIRRTDAELALAAGTATIFGSRYRYLPLPLSPSLLFTLPSPLGDVSFELQPMIQDIFVLCRYASHRHVQLGTIEYQDMIISIIQRLIDYAPLEVKGSRPPRPLDDVCQLGFLSFMTTVLHRDPHKRSAYSEALSGLFRARLEELYASTSYSLSELSFYFWLNFVYALSAPMNCDDYETYADRLRFLSKMLAITSWDAAVAHLHMYPWVDAFHDKIGRKIWEQATCG